MILGCLIHVFSLAVVVAASHFGKITPALEADIAVVKWTSPDGLIANQMVSNKYGQLTISYNSKNGSIATHCSESCVAYVQNQNLDSLSSCRSKTRDPLMLAEYKNPASADGPDYALYATQIAHDASVQKGPIKNVFFILGNGRIGVESLKEEFEAAQKFPDRKYQHTIYTIPILTDQEEQEEIWVEAVPPCPYFGDIIPSPGVWSSVEVSKVINGEESIASLKVTSEHHSVAIERDLISDTITISCSERCVAYVEHEDGHTFHIDSIEPIVPETMGPVKKVFFIFGHSMARVETLKNAFENPGTFLCRQVPRTLYVVPIPARQQGNEEVEEMAIEAVIT